LVDPKEQDVTLKCVTLLVRRFRKLLRNAMKTKEQYIRLLSEFRKSRGSVYGISRIGIFGSVARGEHKEGSDVDIYYEGEPLSLFRLAALKDELETTLESPVDIVRIRKSMNQLLERRIKRDGLYV